MKLLYFILITAFSSSSFAQNVDPLFLNQLLNDEDQIITGLITQKEAVKVDYTVATKVQIAKLQKSNETLSNEVLDVFQTYTRSKPQLQNIWLADTVIVKAKVSEWRKVLDQLSNYKIIANQF